MLDAPRTATYRYPEKPQNNKVVTWELYLANITYFYTQLTGGRFGNKMPWIWMAQSQASITVGYM